MRTNLSKHTQRVRRLHWMADTQDVLTVDARGILTDEETLTTVKWESDSVWVVSFIEGAVSDSATTATVSATGVGFAMLKCQVTTSAGTKRAQYFLIEVTGESGTPGTTDRLDLTNE